jgi:Neurotransmitter-gated ion-channel ligand binding domain/Neurotransmitter-gated ion-channel transmembrane region
MTTLAVRAACALAIGMLLLSVGGICGGAFATGYCELPTMRSGERPDPDGGPTVVKLGVLVADITAVDDVAQHVEGDFIVKMQWRDPRLAGLAGCQFPRTSVWFPNIELLNSSEVSRKRLYAADQITVGKDGNVTHFQRYFGWISTYHQLQRFPFDSHLFKIRLADFAYTNKELQIEVDSEFTGLADLLNIPDWTIRSAYGEVQDFELHEFHRTLSLFVLVIDLYRHSRYYIFKVIMPLMFITMMSWIVFWISPEKFGPQIGLSATSMLTLIAFQFSLTSELPKVSYFTLMDRLLLVSTTLVFLSLIVSASTSFLVTKGKGTLAHQIDFVCRWLFPLALFVSWLIIFL